MTARNQPLHREARWAGVGALAAALGLSRHHVTAVLHGRRRPGPELAAELERRGIRYPRLRRPEERW